MSSFEELRRQVVAGEIDDRSAALRYVMGGISPRMEFHEGQRRAWKAEMSLRLFHSWPKITRLRGRRVKGAELN